MSREYKHWNTEKKLIPVMIRMYCRGNHKAERKAEGVKGKARCSDWKNALSRETKASAHTAKYIATSRSIARR